MLTSPFNRFGPPKQRMEANQRPYNTFPAANAGWPANELSRRIKWPSDLNSLGVDSMEAFRPAPRLAVPFHFPATLESSSMAATQSESSLLQSNKPTNLGPTTIESTSAAISDKNPNPYDTLNETANIVFSEIDIIANTTNPTINITGVTNASPTVPAAAAAAATAGAQQTTPNGFQPEIYIDENGIFQIKYVRQACDGKNNGTISIETFAANAISPIANNASEQHTNTSSSINAESDETAINSYDDQQFELDVRFEGPNIKDSNRDKHHNITRPPPPPLTSSPSTTTIGRTTISM